MDDAEARFLRMLRDAPEDDTTRLVYADWLESEGEHERAAFLRTVCKLAGKVHRKKLPILHQRLVKLSASSDPAWRAAVSRPSIEKCPELRFRCPKKWSALAPTDDPTVRHCHACARPVHFCATFEEIRTHGRQGDCVAFDPALSYGAAMLSYDRERGAPDDMILEMGEVA